ncbi:hypothetical protein CASFOL_005430 [Castilleja foliolosa]|uniref:Uncharacterized protein n=1 Tax=Castilleja foliolosa TaxID=1961234 RepID=A0ABD3E5E5_9LAMI
MKVIAIVKCYSVFLLRVIAIDCRRMVDVGRRAG